ncbi:hypothetical protein K0040_03505 [Terrisporobacter petrolearius]|uniref:hypothetical protein n=1 Tax=Terrisporobacter petrolearius TaxID=1460447 RepID=UPI001D165EE1|nr:hypothetical protein [Terrisporobacter petrolearius]MCC3863377.1 hypothetical protein [Terrisporobacter petrolearius]
MQVKLVVQKSNNIKDFINETAKRYSNFTDFYIRPHGILSDTYEIILCFNGKTNVNNEKIMQIEVIKDVNYSIIPDFLVQINDDFDNLIDVDIIQYRDKKHLALIILKFECNKDVEQIITTDVYHMSWSGGSDIGQTQVELDINKYSDGEPNPISSQFEESLLITHIRGGMAIRLRYSLKNIDMLFKIYWDDDKNVYKIIEYGLKDYDKWSNERIVIQERIVEKIDIDELSKDVVRKLEKELGIIISNRSINEVHKDIEEISKYCYSIQ